MKKILCVCLFVGLLFSLTACNFEVAYKLPNEEEVIINSGNTKADLLEDEDFEKSDTNIGVERAPKEDFIVDGVILGADHAEKFEDETKDAQGSEEVQDSEEVQENTDDVIYSTWRSDTTEENPASWDEFVLVDEHNYNVDKVETLGVKLVDIYRGDEAVGLIKEYTDSSTFYEYTEAGEGYSWEVFKLGIDFSNYTITYSTGLLPDLSNFKLITVGESSLFTEEGFHIVSKNTITVNPERVLADDVNKYREILIAMVVPENIINPVIQLGSPFSSDTDMRRAYISYTE